MNSNFWLLVAVLEPVLFLVPNNFLARVARKQNLLVNRLPRVEEEGMIDPATARAAVWILKSTKYKCWMDIYKKAVSLFASKQPINPMLDG